MFDELISYLKAHRIRDDIEYYTKYELAEDCNKKGEKTKEYTFNSVKIKLNSNVNEHEILKTLHNDDNSMYNYLKVTTSDFAYFPLIYKINKSDKSFTHVVIVTIAFFIRFVAS